jgi:pyruvate/2-oxoglutarate dehydrogenase complex dihydrolipoamide acyltransferase (E2) component
MRYTFSDKVVNIYAPSTIKDSAVITWWHFTQGDYMVESNEMVEIEEGEMIHIIHPPSRGTILQILAGTGTEVKANQIIGVFEIVGFKTKILKAIKHITERN